MPAVLMEEQAPSVAKAISPTRFDYVRSEARTLQRRRPCCLWSCGRRSGVVSSRILSGYSDHRCDAALDIFVRGGPTGHADAHGRVPVPLRSSAPAGPILCTPAMTRCVSSSLPNETRTWFKTTSFRMVKPAARRRCANKFACRQFRSISSASPVRPRERIAAHNSTPRARRDASGAKCQGSRPAPGVRYAALIAMAAWRCSGLRTMATAES